MPSVLPYKLDGPWLLFFLFPYPSFLGATTSPSFCSLSVISANAYWAPPPPNITPHSTSQESLRLPQCTPFPPSFTTLQMLSPLQPSIPFFTISHCPSRFILSVSSFGEPCLISNSSPGELPLLGIPCHPVHTLYHSILEVVWVHALVG